MKWIATRKKEQNEAALDPWTAVHLAVGLAVGLMDWPAGRAMGAALAYEMAEQAVERTSWGKRFFKTSRPESAPNALVDLVVFAIGHGLGRRWNRS